MSDFKTSWFSVSLATYTVDTGTIFKKMETKNNQRIPDLAEFAEKVRQAYANLDSEGFDVINVIPLSMGTSESCVNAGGGYLGDVGFSITRGAVVVGKKRD